MSKQKLRKAATARFVVGREAFGKISAVEGLHMTRAMRDDFRALDAQGATARARRETLAAKYGK